MSEPAHYKPGQSVRWSVTVQQLDVLTNPPNLTMTLHSPDGSTIVDAAPVNDSTGNYHSDQVIPLSATPGPWVRRWAVSGSAANQNALVEDPFYVDRLLF